MHITRERRRGPAMLKDETSAGSVFMFYVYESPPGAARQHGKTCWHRSPPPPSTMLTYGFPKPKMIPFLSCVSPLLSVVQRRMHEPLLSAEVNHHSPAIFMADSVEHR